MTEDAVIRNILTDTRSIAVLGLSPNPARPSNRVTRFLVDRSFDVFGVNPGQAGKVIQGAPVVGSLQDLDGPVDMIDVFRASSHLAAIADEIMVLAWRPAVFWTQLGVADDAVAARLQAEGMTVVQNRCPAIEMPRLGL